MQRMSWYYEQNGAAVGPVTESEFSNLLASGTVGPATLVWREGMPNWQPHSEVPSAAPARAAATPAATCRLCGGSFPADEVVSIAGTTVCAGCKPRQIQLLQQGGSVASSGIWRSGRTLIASRDAQFPDRCVRCGGVNDLRRVKKRLYWHHPAIYLVILAGLLVYVIVALVVRKRADIEISVCAADRSRRAIKIVVACLLWIAFFVSFPALAANNAPEWMWFLPPLLLIGAVVVTMLARLVYAKKIDEKNVWIRGVCDACLADLPAWPGH